MPGGKKAEYAPLFDAMGEIMKKFDITAIGEILIDFTPAGKSQNGRTLFEENPGGATVNVAAAAAKLGAKSAFIGKIGNDAFGCDAKAALENCGVCTGAMKTNSSAICI